MTDRSDRGDYRSYFLSVIILCSCIVVFLLFYFAMDPLFTEIWDARSGWYIDRYRTWGAKVWRFLHRSTSSWLFLWIPLLWMLSTFLIQFGLTKDKARVFNKVHLVGVLVLFALAFLSFFGLILLPVMIGT